MKSSTPSKDERRRKEAAEHRPHPQRSKRDLDARLDEALDDTFPASDPIELSSFRD